MNKRLPELLQKKTKEQRRVWGSAILGIERELRIHIGSESYASLKMDDVGIHQEADGVTLKTSEGKVSQWAEYLTWVLESSHQKYDPDQTELWMKKFMLHYRMFSLVSITPDLDAQKNLESTLGGLIRSYTLCRVIIGAMPLIERQSEVAEQNAVNWESLDAWNEDSWGQRRPRKERLEPNLHENFIAGLRNRNPFNWNRDATKDTEGLQ
jgi:hypothetical protein